MSKTELLSLHDIVKRIVGPIQPIGEHGVDSERLENLKLMADLADRLIFDIKMVSHNADRPENSVRATGEYACKFLGEMKDALE